MKISDYDYDLNEKMIANRPPKIRGQSNLLVLNRTNQTIEKHQYSDVVDFLQSGDVLVINDTKVLKARLLTKKITGVTRELIVLESHAAVDDWHEHHVIHRGRIRVGEILYVGEYQIEVLETFNNGVARVRSQIDLLTICDQYGTPPLPPYMNRLADESDIERYQTVWAKNIGSVAAPTASLNMTEKTLQILRRKGVKIVYLTLHVGLGTFLPIRTDDVEKHQMHKEYFEISQKTITTIRQAKEAGNAVIALGTTVTRTLEFLSDQILDFTTPATNLAGEANIFIYPGYNFKIVDHLITNFHAPRSTVLMMAAAFAGWDFLKKSYQFAQAEKMRFLSYGDSMLIL
ncbi:MAG: tRNA preQ1(34) S-adenosylmethionine ribosyltransferase-isomerase QueA [Candidatus Saccharibacteria bacterium]|nr:tRNA preQ1(34) S-adenosylmethionine ribosyltransferase-isomerase QueA [Candidatus Saccharibacteria bacterium]